MIRTLFLLSISFLSTYASAKQYPVRLGDTKVIVKQTNYGCGKAFVHLHQNERTALKAANSVAKTRGGSVLTLVHPGERNIVFHVHHKRYEFDPNRIFSDIGIKKTLRKHGRYSQVAHREAKKLAKKIISLLPQGKVVAVHNNKGYSMKDYFPGRSYAGEIRSIHHGRHQGYRNFFLVTKQRDYVRLKQLNFNSVWQAEKPTEDGSLSVFMGKNWYVNVEAGYNQLTAQKRMLRYA
jgi:hypothetical protein